MLLTLERSDEKKTVAWINKNIKYVPTRLNDLSAPLIELSFWGDLAQKVI
jgi:hypothetical protein